MTENKVKFNIKSLHYAKKTAEGYSTPVALPGAVSISLKQQGDLSDFYADGVKYYVSSSNGGYQGDLEVARITDDFRETILKETKDTNNVLIEDANAHTEEFAIGFEVDGNIAPIKFWFFNCTATRPDVEATTNEGKKDPKTDTISLSCAPSADGNVRAKTTANTPENVLSTWYSKVYEKVEEND